MKNVRLEQRIPKLIQLIPPKSVPVLYSRYMGIQYFTYLLDHCIQNAFQVSGYNSIT